MKRLFVIATGSAGKIRDFAHILGTDHYEFKTLKDIGFDEDIIEDGNSFAENAIIKSNTTAQWLAKRNIEATVLADDSGLEVFALNGEPGIYSARYCGKHGDDEANNVKLMQKLEGIEDRKARYFCALSYQTVTKNEQGEFVISKPIIFEGECRGEINHAPVGDMGKANAVAKSTTLLSATWALATIRCSSRMAKRERLRRWNLKRKRSSAIAETPSEL